MENKKGNRNRMACSRTMKYPELALAREYASRLRARLGDRLREIILFGSQARGDATVASDYDIIVIVNRKDRQIREMVTDTGVDMMDEYEALFAALIYDEQEWRHAQAFPLSWNVRREGIVL